MGTWDSVGYFKFVKTFCRKNDFDTLIDLGRGIQRVELSIDPSIKREDLDDEMKREGGDDCDLKINDEVKENFIEIRSPHQAATEFSPECCN